MNHIVLEIGQTPDANRRGCFDCRFCASAVSWWCVSQEAVEWRGTNIPGVHNCPFWKPAFVAHPITVDEEGRRRGWYAIAKAWLLGSDLRAWPGK